MFNANIPATILPSGGATVTAAQNARALPSTSRPNLFSGD